MANRAQRRTSGNKPIKDPPAASANRQRPLDAQARLAAILESSDDAIIAKSLDGTILDWNPAAQRLFGYTAAQAVGQQMNLIVPPDRLKEEIQFLTRIRKGRQVD